MNDMPKTMATTIYRGLLSLLPSSFREPYGTAMVETFRAREEERRYGEPIAYWLFFVLNRANYLTKFITLT